MKCHECGHDVHVHCHWGECREKGCKCGETPDRIRVDAWEAEARTARAYIAAMEAEIEKLHGNPPMMRGGEFSKLYDAYRDSRVDDEVTK